MTASCFGFHDFKSAAFVNGFPAGLRLCYRPVKDMGQDNALELMFGGIFNRENHISHLHIL